jgi:solute carrier family 41
MEEPSRNDIESPLQHVSDDIGLDTLQEVLVSPRTSYRTATYDLQDTDDDIELRSDGSAALLGSGGRTRELERIPSGSVWSQVGNIVVEVRGYNLQSRNPSDCLKSVRPRFS